MHLIIPMAGYGSRFIKNGYDRPKPFIIVDEKPMICHVVDMFNHKDIDKVTFICNKEHKEYQYILDQYILDLKFKKVNILYIDGHKNGPVYTLEKCKDYINDSEKVIVSYCDFNSYFSISKFMEHYQDSSTIFAYKGFHPHMLGPDNYAFMLTDKDDNVLAIQEKKPFTDNRMEEYASNGIYYFKTGYILKHYCSKLIESNIRVNNEFYVSMLYNLMIADKLQVKVFEIQHMLQFGTPRDLEEYIQWSNYFKNITVIQEPIYNPPGTMTVLPLAGHGSRFKGYKKPKPLLDVTTKPMVIQAISCLPRSDYNIFICLNEHLNEYDMLSKELKKYDPLCKIIGIDGVTEGQACTCEIALKDVSPETPILITACDNSAYYNNKKYIDLVYDNSVDVIVWSFKNNATSKNYPHMYSWLKVDKDDNILEVSVKNCKYDEPKDGTTIVGTMFFRKNKYFLDALSKIYEKNIRTNGEFYVDNLLNECIDAGLKVKSFCVDFYVCYGTPNDYEIYKYWQSYFHKNSSYKVQNDTTANSENVFDLVAEIESSDSRK